MGKFFFIFIAAQFACLGFFAFGFENLEKKEPNKAKAKREVTTEYMFSVGGYVDDLKLSGAENWYGIYVDKTKVSIVPAKLVVGDAGSIGTQVLNEKKWSQRRPFWESLNL